LAQETGTQSFAALLDANTAAPDRQLNQRGYRKTLPAYGQARSELPFHQRELDGNRRRHSHASSRERRQRCRNRRPQ
jgi:hypothetical protein